MQDEFGREVMLVEDERGAVYSMPGWQIILGERNDAKALEMSGMFDRPPSPALIPQVVTMRQFRAALIEMDLDQEVETFLAAVPDKDGRRARADYVSATEVRRDWPLLVAMAAAMGKTPADIDAVMTLAATL